MTTGGWIFLLCSLTFVWGLAGWCFYKVFNLPPDGVSKEPQDFRSA